jgi:hypothetical protein
MYQVISTDGFTFRNQLYPLNAIIDTSALSPAVTPAEQAALDAAIADFMLCPPKSNSDPDLQNH